MVGIGIVGIGFMGMIHYLAARELARGEVVALCSRDPRKLAGDWTGIQGNFGPPGARMDLSSVARHADFDAFLSDPSVDLVDLCVPTSAHARMAKKALEAGKHVLVEKPIALSLEDADAMVAAARANDRLLMVAHVLPFFPEFAFAAEAVQSGRYGKVRAGNFSRVIAQPDWSTEFADFERNGGPAIDLHIHDTHYLGWLIGIPRSVHSRGVVERGAVVYIATQYQFDDPNLTVTAVSGALSQPGRPFQHGFELYLEHATLTFSFASFAGGAFSATPLSVILPDGRVEHPALGTGDPVAAFTNELATAVDGVASGKAPDCLSATLARQALRLCHAEIESVETRAPATVG
jgi:predicted dehydrogenase